MVREGCNPQGKADQFGTGPLGQAAIDASATALGAALPAAAPAIAGVATLLKNFGLHFNDLTAARDQLLVEAATAQASLPAEELMELLRSTEPLSMFTAHTIENARRAQMREKATFLGQCLGTIAHDPARIDAESLWVNLIGRLERPHLKVAFLFKHDDATAEVPERASTTPERAGQVLGLGAMIMPITQELLALGVLVRPGSKALTYGSSDSYGEVLTTGPLFGELIERLERANILSESL